jgi:anaphase-promoting complex subunit 1
VHLPALLTGTNPEFSTSVRVQTACVAGIGLLYMQTCDRKMIETFVGEIVGNQADVLQSGANMESLTESYSVASGFSVGFMALGKGEEMKKIANRLLGYLTGNTTQPAGALARSQNASVVMLM